MAGTLSRHGVWVVVGGVLAIAAVTVRPLPPFMESNAGRQRFPYPGRSELCLARRLGETQSAGRGRVAALVPVVPLDPVARRGRAMDDLLYDAGPRWPLGRLGLDLHPISCLQVHAAHLHGSLALQRVIPERPRRIAARASEWNHRCEPRPTRGGQDVSRPVDSPRGAEARDAFRRGASPSA